MDDFLPMELEVLIVIHWGGSTCIPFTLLFVFCYAKTSVRSKNSSLRMLVVPPSL